MDVFGLIYWVKTLLFVAPIWFTGIVITRLTVSSKRAELVYPAGLIGGVVGYIFLLNLVSHVAKAGLGIWSSYLLFLGLGVFLRLKFGQKLASLDKPRGKSFRLLVFSVFLWALFLFFPISINNFGGDTYSYYSIGKTFARGNFPVMSPWQPDLPVGYHYGAPIFLGALNFFTGTSFDFLHRFLNFLLLLALSQIAIWVFKRHSSLVSLLSYQLLPLVVLVSVGSFMLVFPNFPLDLVEIKSFSEFFTIIRRLPSAGLTFDTYGAPITLYAITYFIHQTVALAGLFYLFYLLLRPRLKYGWFYFVWVGSVLSSLALINETVFLSGIGLALVLLLNNKNIRGYIRLNLIKIGVLLVAFGMIVLFQGGVITDHLIKTRAEKSSLIFLSGENAYVKDLIAGHKTQQSSRLLSPKKEWLSAYWFHPGFEILYPVVFAFWAFLYFRGNKKKAVILLSFIGAAAVTSIVYNLASPRYVPANSTRLIAMSYQMLGVAVVLFLLWGAQSLQKKSFRSTLLTLFIYLWIFIPSFLPPIFEFLDTSGSGNKLLSPMRHQLPKSVDWIKQNVLVSQRVADLQQDYILIDDSYGVYSLGRPLAITAGVLMPVFNNEYRAHDIQAGPDYINLVYTLNPEDIKELKINYLIMDSRFLKTLPELRQAQLNNLEYFVKVFEDKGDLPGIEWQAIFKVESAYLEEVENLPNGYQELNSIIPKNATVFFDVAVSDRPYVDIRRAAMLVLKDRKLFTRGTGGGWYGYIEADMKMSQAEENQSFDYLLLRNTTDPKAVCSCRVKKIWSGFKDIISVWEVIG